MRILVVDTVYPAFAEALYADRPELEREPYEAQRQALWDQCFGTADAYVRHLRDLGHETDGVVINAGRLQRAWLRERRAPAALAHRLQPGVAARHDPLGAQLTLLAQVESFRPDVLYVHDLWYLRDATLRMLRRRVPYLVGQIASHPPPIGRIARYDLVLSSFPHFVQWFRENGIDSEPFALAFYERAAELLARQGVGTAPTGRAGAVLVGGLSPRVYPTVTPAIEQLCAEVEVDVWGYGVEELAEDSPIRARFRGPAWGLDMYRLFAESRVVVNRHGDIAGGVANNARLFEATGMGAALVTEAAPNLRTLFEPEREVVAYTDGDDLVDRVRALLADDVRAAAIGAAGQRRTLADHTYRERMRELSELLASRVTPGRARR